MEFPLYDRTPGGNCGFLGFRMCQNRIAVAVLSYLLETGGFAQVIELGTQLGGLTVLLGLQCHMQGIRLDSFDLEAASPYQEWFERFGVHYHIGDIFRPEGVATIQVLIQAPGRALVLCDNGNKAREFATFAPFLKSGDVIGAHDYHPDGDYDPRRWAWHEIRDTDLQEVCEQHHLEPFLPEAATEAAWVMKIKASCGQGLTPDS